MRFLTRINRNYLIMFSLLLAGITLSGYFILHAVILRNTKENLLSKEYLIEKQILQSGEIPNLLPVLEVKKTIDTLGVNPLFKEIEIWNEREKENEIFLEFSDKIKVNGSFYFIKLRQSVFENEDLVIALVLTLFILLASAFIISYLVTKRMNKTIWTDFEQNLYYIESFSFSGNKSISLLKSDIEEFDRLNRVIKNMTEKLKTDYNALKEFTENSAHEIQTPITIALLNLDEILQNNLDPDTFKKVAATGSALKRLSSLNQSLTLLTKIENRQFIPEDVIDINDLLRNYLHEFEPLFQIKKIEMQLLSEDIFTLKINKQLAGIMISNLLSNSVNHNLNHGLIQITLKKNSLSICNTGPETEFTDENIFNRFVKGQSKSFGLGLAIVKKICETHDLEIHYIKKDLHCFLINSKS
jgi:signal transduction histidine kinase